MVDRNKIGSKFVLSILIPSGLAVWAIFYLLDHLEEFKQAIVWEAWSQVVISIFILVHLTISGLFSQVILKAFGLRLRLVEWLGLAIINTLGNYLLPFRGGAGIRAAYLKKKYSFPLTHFLSTFFAIYVITFMVNALAGLVAMATLPDIDSGTRWVLRLFFVCVLTGTIAVALFPVKTTWFKKTWLSPVARLIDGWRRIKGHYFVIIKLFFLTIANSLSLTLIMYFGYQTMGLDLGLAEVVLMGAILALAGLFAITPGGLGVQEAAVVFSAQVIGITLSQGLALAVIIRAVILFWTFLLGPIFSYLLLKKPVPLISKEL